MRFEDLLLNEKAMTPKQAIKFATDTDYNNISSASEKEFIETWKMITKECKGFIRELRKGDQLLFRGMKNIDNMGSRVPRKNRRPLDTPTAVSDKADEIILELFGWKPRQEGLFTTGNTLFAGGYGDICMVFPVDKYDILWSSKTTDAYSKLRDRSIGDYIRKNYTKELKTMYDKKFAEGHEGVYRIRDKGYNVPLQKKYRIKKAAIKYYVDYIKQSNLIQGDVEEFVKDNIYWDPERSFDGFLNWVRHGYFLDEGRKSWPEGFDKLFSDAVEKMVIDELDYNDKDLRKAIQSGNEIQVKCDKYYYIGLECMPLVELCLWGKTIRSEI